MSEPKEVQKTEEKASGGNPFWWPTLQLGIVAFGYAVATFFFTALGKVGLFLWGLVLFLGAFLAITRRQYHLRQQLDRIEALLKGKADTDATEITPSEDGESAS